MRLADAIRSRGQRPSAGFHRVAGAEGRPGIGHRQGAVQGDTGAFGPGPDGTGPRYRFTVGEPAWGRFGGTGVEPPPGSLPVVNLAADRIASMNADTPAMFEIEGARGEEGDTWTSPWYAIPALGRLAVDTQDPAIGEAARLEGTDPDMTRAVMYVENAHGPYGLLTDLVQEAMDSGATEYLFGPNIRERIHQGDWRLDALPDGLADWPPARDLADWTNRGLAVLKDRLADPSLLPMNIKPRTWGGLGLDFENGFESTANVRAGTSLLRRIAERIPDPDPAKIGSIYNFAGKEAVSDFGRAVDQAYRDKPWLTGQGR